MTCSSINEGVWVHHSTQSKGGGTHEEQDSGDRQEGNDGDTSDVVVAP